MTYQPEHMTSEGLRVYQIRDCGGYFVSKCGRVFGTQPSCVYKYGTKFIGRTQVKGVVHQTAPFDTRAGAARSLAGLRSHNGIDPVYREIGTRRRSKDKPYICVLLTVDGVHRTLSMHRVLAETFIPNPDALPVVRHLDGDGSNNELSNLAWGTHSQNSRDWVDDVIVRSGALVEASKDLVDAAISAGVDSVIVDRFLGAMSDRAARGFFGPRGYA